MKRLFPLNPDSAGHQAVRERLPAAPRAHHRVRKRRRLIGNASDGGYRPVLVLLAMVTGYPVEATEVMRGLLERLKQKDCPANWWNSSRRFARVMNRLRVRRRRLIRSAQRLEVAARRDADFAHRP